MFLSSSMYSITTSIIIVTLFTLISLVSSDTCQWGIGNFNGILRPFAAGICYTLPNGDSTIWDCDQVNKNDEMGPIRYQYTGTSTCDPLEGIVTKIGQFGGNCRNKRNECILYKLTNDIYEYNECEGELINSITYYMTDDINNKRCNGVSSNGKNIDTYINFEISEDGFYSQNYGYNQNGRCPRRAKYDEDSIINGCDNNIVNLWEIVEDDSYDTQTPAPSEEPTEELLTLDGL